MCPHFPFSLTSRMPYKNFQLIPPKYPWSHKLNKPPLQPLPLTLRVICKNKRMTTHLQQINCSKESIATIPKDLGCIFLEDNKLNCNYTAEENPKLFWKSYHGPLWGQKLQWMSQHSWLLSTPILTLLWLISLASTESPNLNIKGKAWNELEGVGKVSTESLRAT